jgi:hypothetical protein
MSAVEKTEGWTRMPRCWAALSAISANPRRPGSGETTRKGRRLMSAQKLPVAHFMRLSLTGR